MDRPIPAFYACYLLRSTVRHQNIYVGSTPHPVRRLKQHNGIAKGGAVRTSRDTLRPWEMTCLVTGFPSKIAALQFEWAWQNTHLTRHIAPDERITQTNTKTRYSPKTGRARKRVGRPRMSMTDKLANLHILLRAKSFERWPLKVKFFAEDVYKMWHRWVVKLPEVLRHGILVELEPVNPQQQLTNEEHQPPKGIQVIDPTYLHAKPMLQKSRRLLAATSTSCAVCKSPIHTLKEMALACPETECNSLSHVACLSNHFLSAENASTAIVPTDGQCPSCKSHICWTDMIRDLSLRVRGEKEVTALFKEPKRRKKADSKSAKAPVAPLEEEDDEEEDLDDLLVRGGDLEVDYEDGLLRGEYEDIESLQSLSSDEDWKIIDDIDGVNDKVIDTASVSKAIEKAPKSKKVVIEDSDWDEAEVID